MTTIRVLLPLIAFLLLPAPNFASEPVLPAPPAQENHFPVKMTSDKLPPTAFELVQWTDLMPKEDLEALLNPPEYITNVEDGSIEDQIASQLRSAQNIDDPYQQALVSTRIVSKMDSKAIRIPGFVVPLEFDDEQVITQFFLVPFFGACLHLPPPPPNQIIFVESPEGVQLENLYEPVWISGVLKTSMIENEVATAAYTMVMQYSDAYSD